MEFRILGPIGARANGVNVDIGPARQRSILGSLLVEPERPASLEALVDRVWGDEPPNGVRGLVHTYITRLRRALAGAVQGEDLPVVLARTSSGYQLDIDPGDVDLSRFNRLVQQARRADAARRSALLEQALRTWHGEALTGMTSDWAERLRENLRQAKTEALTQWADSELLLGRPATTVPDLRAALLADPMSEPLTERLMRALYVDGRSVDALEQYHELRGLIADQFGADPSLRLQELYETVLRGDRLDLAPLGDGSVAGGPHRVPATGSALEPPQLLPTGLPDFTGRDFELACSRRALTVSQPDTSPALLVVGGGGIGKTALAVHTARRLIPGFPDGQLYVDLLGSTPRPADPQAVLARLLRALGADAAAQAEDHQERVEAYRASLVGKRVLVVLDDVADDTQLASLLPKTPGVAVLMTSRRRLGSPVGATVIHLKELPDRDATTLLAKIIGPARMRADHASASALVQLCAGLPLAVRAAGTKLASRPHWPISRFVARIADESRRLDELAHGSLDVRASLTASYNALPQAARRLLCQLGRLPSAEFDARVAWPSLGGDFETVEDACEELVDAHLLDLAEDWDTDGRVRYRLSGLQRAYARELAAGPVRC
jgi:DNA-binding SARP family transcriptional activator